MSVEPQEPRLRFISGKSIIESVFLSLTYLDYKMRLETGETNIYFLTDELERQLCGYARAVPQAKKVYHAMLKETLREHFKDYPLPEVGPQCRMLETIIKWLENNKHALYKDELLFGNESQIERKIQETATEIVYQSVLGTLYQLGLIS